VLARLQFHTGEIKRAQKGRNLFKKGERIYKKVMDWKSGGLEQTGRSLTKAAEGAITKGSESSDSAKFASFFGNLA
jgi:hypothetical protein